MPFRPLLGALLLGALTLQPATRPGSATLTLWAWERPEDLSFLAGSTTRVAYLAATVELHGTGVMTRPRAQPLRLPAGIARMPVLRVALHAADPPRWTSEQARVIVEQASRLARRAESGRGGEVQIDFDAPLSGRDFYRGVLADLRARLPPNSRVSITAIASWCLGDAWVRDLPVDEIVPMAFRMGRDARVVRALLRRGGRLEARCRGSLGLATDELDVPARTDDRTGGRTYLFSAEPWTAANYQRSVAALRENAS